jgi:MYXO-CTERM domain-containing protein
MMKSYLSCTALALCLPAALWSAPAAACSCAETEELSASAPADGAEGVPTNLVAALFYGSSAEADRGAEAVSLLDADGQAVEITVAVVSSGGRDTYLQVTPAAELEAGADYQLVEREFSAWFSTAEGADDSAPGTAGLLDVQASAERGEYTDCDGITMSNSCGDYALVQLSLEAADGAAYYEVSAAADADGVSHTILVPSTDFSLNMGHCGGNLDALLDSEAVEFEVRAVDLAGNVGSWTAATTAVLPWPAEPECDAEAKAGCATGAGPAGALLGLLGLLGAATRRR